MAEDRPPPTDEIVGLLQKRAPEVLARLRAEHPDHDAQQLLREGIIGGGKADKMTRLRAELALQGLTAASTTCEEFIPKIRRSLRRANNFQFWGQITTALGGGTVLSTLLFKWPVASTYVGGLLTLLGSILPTIAQKAGSTLHPSAGNLFDIYRELIDCRLESRLVIQELEPWIKSGYRAEPKLEVITKANVLCARIERAIAGY